MTTTILGTGDSQCACEETLIVLASVFLCAPGAYTECAERVATRVAAGDLHAELSWNKQLTRDLAQ